MEAIDNQSIGQAALNTQASVSTKDSTSDTGNTEVKDTSAVSTEGGDFAAYLSKTLGKSGQETVNEEELFSALISERLNEIDQEASLFYDQKVKELSTSMARSDGYIPLEDVAKAALRETVAAGNVTTEQAEKLHAEAFAGAQLDDNAMNLYDGRGDTVAVGSMEEAMFKVQAVLDQIEAGTLVLDPRPLDVMSNIGTTPGTELTGEGIEGELGREIAEGAEAESAEAESAEEGSEKQVRFTWKHEASDGNLAILLPTKLNGQIAGVSLFDKEGNLLEKGDYSKQTGDKRAVFRFNDPGGEYGKDVDAVVYLDNGQTLTYHVKNGGERTYVPQDDYTKKSKAELEKDMAAKHSKNELVVDPPMTDSDPTSEASEAAAGSTAAQAAASSSAAPASTAAPASPSDSSDEADSSASSPPVSGVDNSAAL